MKPRLLQFLIFVCIFAATSCIKEKDTDVQYYDYKITNTFPHDNEAFTQGLYFNDGFFYESTGRYGRSSLRMVQPDTGKIIKNHNLAKNFFAEGLTILDNNIYQLTWKSQIGFVYDKDSFQQKNKFYYTTEGWGLTHDGKNLIMSDGSAYLYYLNPDTLSQIKKVWVKEKNMPILFLNELEYIKGLIYANIWNSNQIVIINPKNGNVTGWINLKGIALENKRHGVLNGIAYDIDNNKLFVTGKLWPKIYEIELISK